MDKKFSLLRQRIKKSQSFVMERIIAKHDDNICILCGASEEITREHIIPQWAFEAKPDKFFISTKNNQPTNYIKATVPACRVCNSELLGAFEDTLKRTLNEKEADCFDSFDLDCIIWWLQYIGFKLQVMDLRNRFLRYRGGKYIKYLADIPIAMFWGDIDTSPGRVFRILRKSRRALTKKWKDQKYNSLIVFHTSNRDYHFFHKVDDFIFIELPQLKKAFFYFFNKEFDDHAEAYKECMEIIEKHYKK